MSEEKYQFQIERIYIAIARSMVRKPLDNLIALQKEGVIDHNKAVNIGFGILGTSCTYSYAAIEAFCNKHYWDAQAIIREIENSNSGKAGWRYMGHSFRNLRKNGLTFNINHSLDKKLKNLCKLYKIKEISDKKPELWQQFKNLLVDSRHFIIHPKPRPEDFQNMTNKILNEDNPTDYVNTAVLIMGYFYEETREPIPEWLKKTDDLFEFSGINVFEGFEKHQGPGAS